jgi:imidazolonepropionase
MKNAVLIRGARQLLTLRGPSAPRRGTALRELGLIPDGAVLIRDGRIFAVGQGRRVENLAEARNAFEIDATRRVILPGFVDSHTHLVSGPPRLDDYERRIAGQDRQEAGHLEAGILSGVRAVRKTSARSLERQARSLVGLFIRNGATTLEAKSGYGLDRTGEMKTLKVLAKLDQSPLDVIPTYLGAHAVPPEYEGTPHNYIDWISAEMLPRIGRQKLARFVDVCCGRGAFRLDDARRYLEAARRLGFGLKIHAEQFSHSGSVRLAVELAAISADHLEYVDQDDIAILAQSSTIATLLPGSVFHMDSGHYAPARALIDQGVAVALATGFNPSTSPTCNMQMILSLACTQMRMTPAEAISAATINGAHALGCADRLGSLEAGKYADLTLFDVSDYREIPYQFGVNQVALTMKKGIVLYRRTGVGCPENL